MKGKTAQSRGVENCSPAAVLSILEDWIGGYMQSTAAGKVILTCLFTSKTFCSPNTRLNCMEIDKHVLVTRIVVPHDIEDNGEHDDKR
jgi:hypothetical protein